MGYFDFLEDLFITKLVFIFLLMVLLKYRGQTEGVFHTAGYEHVLNEFRHSCQRPKLKNVCHKHSKVK